METKWRKIWKENGEFDQQPEPVFKERQEKGKNKRKLREKKKKSFLGKRTTKESPGLQMKREKEKDKFSSTRGRFEVAMEYWNNDV